MKIGKKKILAVEVAGNHIYAALAAKKGKGFEITEFTQVERQDTEDDLPGVDGVKTLAARLDYTSGPAVYVTSLARSVEILMNTKKVSGMRHYQLMEAVKWEVEPYTGVSGAQALIGVEKIEKAFAKDKMVPEEDEEEITVNVSVIEKNIYRAVRERFKAAGLKLLRIYPPEVCFYMTLFMEDFESPRAILDIGPDYSKFAVLKGEKPAVINTLPISMEAIISHLTEDPSEELESALKFTARQSPAPIPLTICGLGAGDKRIVEYVSSLCANRAAAITINNATGVTEPSDAGRNGVYATVAGAAIRELFSKKHRLAGINDTEPLVPRLKKSAYLMPLIATVLLSTILFGHFQYMRWQGNIYKERIKKLSDEVKNKKGRITGYEQAKQEAENLRNKITLTEKKIAFAAGKADEDIAHVINIFSGFAHMIPGEIVLKKITQEDLHKYNIEGTSISLSSVGGFATKMQENKWCESVVIKLLEKDDGCRLRFEFLVKTLEVNG